MANPDSAAFEENVDGTINVLANDTDPEGHYPLTLLSVSDPSGASVVSGNMIGWGGNSPGTYQISYTIRDSQGAIATGTLTVTVSPAPPPDCGDQLCEPI